MTNTKFRKRALLSSVAMLLVALVALGSATFAWFSQDSKASANGIGAKTTQASNILVSESGENNTWGNKITFATFASGDNKPVTPGADIKNPSWVTTTSDGLDLGIKGTADYSPAVENTDYTATKLFVKYDATEGNQPVDIAFNYSTSTGTENYLRVALVPLNQNAKTLFGDAGVVYGNSKDDFAKDPTKFTALDAPNVEGANSIVTTESKTLYTNKSLVANTEYSFNVYVWYEGTDPQCIDTNAGTNYVVNFEVTKHV